MAKIGVSGLPGFTASSSINEKTELYHSTEQTSIASVIIPQDFFAYQGCLLNCNYGYKLCMGHLNADPAKCAKQVKACRTKCMIWCYSPDVTHCNIDF